MHKTMKNYYIVLIIHLIKTPYINEMKRGYFEVKNHLPKIRS